MNTGLIVLLEPNMSRDKICLDGNFQMGSHMKTSIFNEQTAKALKNWRMAVKKKQGGRAGRSPTRSLGDASPTASMVSGSVSSTVHSSTATLHRFKTMGHSTRSFTYDDQDTSDLEADQPSTESSTAKLIVRVADDDTDIETTVPHNGGEPRNEDDFSFTKPAPLK